MFYSEYVLPFTEGSMQTAAEPEEVLAANGWRYEFTRKGDRITMFLFSGVY